MNYKAAQNYLSEKPAAFVDYPFGPEAEVYKVKDKLFAILMTRQGIDQINLKCDPEEAIALRDIFEGVIPGYHMNKKHWNTVLLDGTVPRSEIERMIDNSYSLIVKSLKKVERKQLELEFGEKTLYG